VLNNNVNIICDVRKTLLKDVLKTQDKSTSTK